MFPRSAHQDAVRSAVAAWTPLLPRPDGFVVGDFESRVRVLHPLDRWPGVAEPTVPWRDVATALGAPLSATTRWEDLIAAAPDEEAAGGRLLWDGEPARGSLPSGQASALARALSPGRDTDCFFAVWTGWGDLDEAIRTAPTARLSELTMLLLEGTAADAAVSLGTDVNRHRSANVWWAVDGSFAVTTSVDGRSSHVSASRTLITAVLATPGIESVLV